MKTSGMIVALHIFNVTIITVAATSRTLLRLSRDNLAGFQSSPNHETSMSMKYGSIN